MMRFVQSLPTQNCGGVVIFFKLRTKISLDHLSSVKLESNFRPNYESYFLCVSMVFKLYSVHDNNIPI